MRVIYLVKLGQLAAIVAVVVLFLSVGKFCGEIEMQENNHSVDDRQINESGVNMAIKLKVSFIQTPKHWSSKVAGARQKKQDELNETNLSDEHVIQKRDVAQAQGEPDTGDDSATELSPISDMHSTDHVTTEPTTTPIQRFGWHADGCIPVPPSDFFNPDPETHAALIASRLSWSVVLVSCHSLIILFQLYLVYASHLPPSNNGDFVRTVIGFLLWYAALSNLIFVHYNWTTDWMAETIMVIPKFPDNWITIEVICIVVIVSMLLEECLRQWLYSNVNFVPDIKTPARASQQSEQKSLT